MSKINKAAQKVYTKTEDAMLVSKYEHLFAVDNADSGDDYGLERDIIFLQENKKRVLDRCKELEKESEPELTFPLWLKSESGIQNLSQKW